MILHAEGGTDGAMMGLFWPAYLPKEPSAELQDDPIGLIEALDRQSRLINLPCDGDGRYALGVYLDETPSDELLKSYQKKNSYPEVMVEGSTFYGGLEYLFENNCEGEGENYIGLCEVLEVPPGTYEVDVYASTLMHDRRKEMLIERTGMVGRFVLLLENLFFVLGVLAVLAGPASLVLLIWYSKAIWILCASILIILLVFFIGRIPPFYSVNAARGDIKKEFPHYLVTMRKKAD